MSIETGDAAVPSLLEECLQQVFSLGGFRVRGGAQCVCRDWRRVAGADCEWRVEYEGRWWHAPPGLEAGGREWKWRASFAARIGVEQACLALLGRLASAEAGAALATRSEVARGLEAIAGARPEEARELLASVGCLCGNRFCASQFERAGVGGVTRPPPDASAARLRRFADVGGSASQAVIALRGDALPGAAASREAQRVGSHAAAALAHACSARVAERRGSVASLEAGLARVADGLRVFYDGPGAEAELTRLANAHSQLLSGLGLRELL